jgi:hypothetical protein
MNECEECLCKDWCAMRFFRILGEECNYFCEKETGGG